MKVIIRHLWLTQSYVECCPIPSFLVPGGLPAAWPSEVLPVRLALAALHPAEEALDEGFGFCSDCGHRHGQSSQSWPKPSHIRPPHHCLTLAFPLTPPLREKVRQVAGEGLEQLLRPNKEAKKNR